MQTIYILWLRQLKKYSRSKSRMLGSLAQPLLFLVSLGYGFGPVYQKAGQGNYIEFLAPGIIGMSIIFTSVFSGMEIIWDRQFGFLKETLVAPVSRWNIMLGRTLGGATVAVLQGAIVFCISLAVGFRPVNIFLVPVAFFVMLLIALLFTAMGIAIASKMDDMQGFQLIINFLVMPLFFLSGALFPLDGLPNAIAIMVRLDPLSYGIDALRGILIGVSHFGVLLDVGVVALVAGIFLFIGSWFFSRVEV
ncbi:MAG: ABC transporter permease [Candidatus Moraniibacteriota bacterium]